MANLELTLRATRAKKSWSLTCRSYQANFILCYNSRQKSLGHLEETGKKPPSSTYCHSCYKHAPPFPLEQCWFACGTLEVGVHAKFSHNRRYFSRKPTLFQGERGMKVRCRIQKVQSVPGLLASIEGFGFYSTLSTSSLQTQTILLPPGFVPYATFTHKFLFQ